MDLLPRLRPIEAIPFQQEGKTLIYLKDPLNLATPLGVSPVGYFIMSHFDGRRSLVDIQENYTKQSGTLLRSHDLRHLIATLDHHSNLSRDRALRHITS